MSSLEEVGILQVVIILLLCEPQRRRRAALGSMIAAGAACAAIYYLGPGLLGLLYEAAKPIVDKYGWLGLLTLVGLLVYAVSFVFAFRADARNKKAIRAGSKQAFDKHVEYLVRDQHLSHEDAVDFVIKMRDGG